MKKILLYFCSLILFGCPVYDPPIKEGFLNIYNQSDYVFYVYSSCNDSIKLTPQLKYIDTIFKKNKYGRKVIDSYQYPIYRAEPNYGAAIGGFGDSHFERKIPCEGNTIKLFLIKESTIKSKNWTEIYNKQLYKKRLSFSQKKLDSLNWIINIH